jgi:hypothetical protein
MSSHKQKKVFRIYKLFKKLGRYNLDEELIVINIKRDSGNYGVSVKSFFDLTFFQRKLHIIPQQ